MKKYALIVAGGKGTRMKRSIAKQYIPIKGLPILMHTLKQFNDYDNSLTLILVIPELDFEYWKQLCVEHNFKIPHLLVTGGITRFQSVKNGLKKIENSALVAIHDGVRPLIAKEIIEKSFEVAAIEGNAIVSVPLKDSIREVSGNKNMARNRADFSLIQTPQTFQSSLIKTAFEQNESPSFTDDASVAEHAGQKINLIEGSYSNIKITTEEDLIIANALINSKMYQ